LSGRKDAMRQQGLLLPPPPPPPPPRGRLYVHVLDGATNYTTELSPNHDGQNTLWPREIAVSGGCSISTNPTVAIKIIDFSNRAAVVVGGGDGMSAFHTFGSDLPGFQAYAKSPPFYNAPTLRNGQIRGEAPIASLPPEATTVDGSVAIVADDNSTYRQR